MNLCRCNAGSECSDDAARFRDGQAVSISLRSGIYIAERGARVRSSVLFSQTSHSVLRFATLRRKGYPGLDTVRGELRFFTGELVSGPLEDKYARNSELVEIAATSAAPSYTMISTLSPARFLSIISIGASCV